MSLDTTIRDKQINEAFERGRRDALDLRTRAADMDGTGIIAEERKAPQFDPDKDYSGWPVGAPVRYEGQVYTLLQPHNAAHYPDSTPASTPALWSITHTTDPAQAKPFAAPNGTSGMYMAGEVCTDPNMPDPTLVYRSVVNGGVHAPSEYIQNWEEVK